MELQNNSSVQDFRMRYPVLIDDIKYIKSRQWVVTYYLLLLYGGIAGFYKLMEFDIGKNPCVQKNVLVIITLLVATLGTYYQYDFQDRIVQYRKHLYDLLNNFSEEFRQSENKLIEKRFANIEGYISWWNGFWLFTFPFILMLWIGALFVCWYFFGKHPNLNVQ